MIFRFSNDSAISSWETSEIEFGWGTNSNGGIRLKKFSANFLSQSQKDQFYVKTQTMTTTEKFGKLGQALYTKTFGRTFNRFNSSDKIGMAQNI